MNQKVLELIKIGMIVQLGFSQTKRYVICNRELDKKKCP